MKKHLFLIVFLYLSAFHFAVYSQTLIWNQCNMFNQGSPLNFNYSQTFTSVQQSSTDVQLSVRFLACQPFASNTAGIRLNGTSFSQTNSTAGNCAYSNNTYTIAKSVFNQAVIDGGGTIVFSCFIRDTCSPGTGCSLTSDPCIQFTATYIVCNEPVTPTFTQVAPICSGESLSSLPSDSNNGINGSWSPAIDNTATTTYTFTPAEGQCASSTTMTITVNPIVTPTFTQVAPICAGETLIALPVDSNNGINGSWSPAVNNTATTTYTFTPTAGQCASSTTMTITVNPIVTPTFTQVAPICAGETLGALPVDSNNGINGSWSPAIDNTATTTYTFTPAEGQCASSTTMTITVNPIVTPTFTQVAPICAGESLSSLPSDSNNGINGSWSPAIDNTATTTYTFTPAEGQCASSTTMTITVNPIVTPTFTQVAPICAGESLSSLPSDSNNGINGSWSPAIDNTATTTYTFTPAEGQCASSTTMTITVNPIVTAPTGSENQTFCIGETVGDLVINGTAIVWYDAPTFGNVVDDSTALIAGSTYYASQTISACESSSRLAVTVSIGGCLANENFESLNLLVYPNPIKNVLNVSSEEVISKVTFYNLLGNEVLHKVINDNQFLIDTTNLSSGIYIVKIFSNDKVKRLKIIKE